jgi:hypothetical protein
LGVNLLVGLSAAIFLFPSLRFDNKKDFRFNDFLDLPIPFSIKSLRTLIDTDNRH